MHTDLWAYLKTAEKPIFIYGMGNGADLIIDRLCALGVKVSGVFASDGFVRGQIFRDYKVKTYREVTSEHSSFIVLTAFGTQRPDLIEHIRKIASEQELYVPDAPVYGKTFFDNNYYNTHLKELHEVKSLFSDKRSRDVFEYITKFKKSGELELLFKSEDSEKETFTEILRLNDGDKIFDLGAFDGDTALKISKHCPNYGKIVAVEPSVKNYLRLLQNTEHMKNTACENAAVSYLNGTVRFGNEGGRNQYIGLGRKTVKTITVDFLTAKHGAPDFIKFDIEGEELNGLIGGENTIRKYKPKLMISAYHRSEDIIFIPQKVFSLRKDYKIFMRRFPCLPCWDTYYIFT